MLKIFIMNNKKRLMSKLAYSTNDHTIPNDICLKEIDSQNQADTLLWKITDNNISDINTIIDDIQQFNLHFTYTFTNNLGNIGLYCLTGKKNKIIAKFEFYVQKLAQESIDNAINEIKNFCEKRNFNKIQIKLQLAYLYNYINSHMYQATILIHNSNKPYKSLGMSKYTQYYSKNTQFTNNLICAFIKKVMQNEQFIKI